MTTGEGAFCASLDADSEGEEGKFYVWSLAEIDAVLGKDDAAFFAAHYDVTAAGNFEGHNILNRLNHLPRSMEDEQRLAPMREKLLAARATRVRPGLDDKVLADWNGLMIAGAGRMPAWHSANRLGSKWRHAHSCSLPPGWRTATGSAIPGARAGCCSPALPPITPP